MLFENEMGSGDVCSWSTLPPQARGALDQSKPALSAPRYFPPHCLGSALVASSASFPDGVVQREGRGLFDYSPTNARADVNPAPPTEINFTASLQPSISHTRPLCLSPGMVNAICFLQRNSWRIGV